MTEGSEPHCCRRETHAERQVRGPSLRPSASYLVCAIFTTGNKKRDGQGDIFPYRPFGKGTVGPVSRLSLYAVLPLVETALKT